MSQQEVHQAISSHPPLSHFKASLLLYVPVTIAMGIVVGVVLHLTGYLPDFVAVFIGDVQGIIGLVAATGILGAAIHKYIPSGLVGVWKNANPPLTGLAAILTVAAFFGPLVAIPYFQADPILHLGRPLLTDPLLFNSQSNWDENQSCQFTGVAYRVNESTPGSYQPCMAEYTRFYNFVYQVHMKIIMGDCGAIIFRANDARTTQYYFRICQNGKYVCTRYDAPGPSTNIVAPENFNPHIQTQKGQTNVLEVLAKGNNIDLWVNNFPLYSGTDSTYNQGQIGVAAEDINSPTVVEFSNARVWELPT